MPHWLEIGLVILATAALICITVCIGIRSDRQCERDARREMRNAARRMGGD